MLLYDRVMERLSSPRLLPDEFTALSLAGLRAAVVYDVTNVIPLLGDWEREKSKAIPKRSPFDMTWVEWFGTGVFWWGKGDYRQGMLISDLQGMRLDGELLSTVPWPETADEKYLVTSFFVLEELRADPGHAPPAGMRQLLKCPLRFQKAAFWSHASNGTGADFQWKSMPPLEGIDAFTGQAVQGIESLGPNTSIEPWPAFMAFALLHCRNVVTAEHVPDEYIQRQCKKHNRPPRVTYKTLHIEVPKAVHDRQREEAECEEDAGPKVRFHLCSGHFVYTKHERYKMPWYYRPAHWRGSKELGEVHKRYKLEAAP